MYSHQLLCSSQIWPQEGNKQSLLHITDLFLVYAALLLASIMFVCHPASFKLLLGQACHLNTYILLLFVRREPRNLLFVGLHLLFIILEVSHNKPKTTKAEIRFLMHKEALSGLYFELDFFFFT